MLVLTHENYSYMNYDKSDIEISNDGRKYIHFNLYGEDETFWLPEDLDFTSNICTMKVDAKGKANEKGKRRDLYITFVDNDVQETIIEAEPYEVKNDRISLLAFMRDVKNVFDILDEKNKERALTWEKIAKLLDKEDKIREKYSGIFGFFGFVIGLIIGTAMFPIIGSIIVGILFWIISLFIHMIIFGNKNEKKASIFHKTHVLSSIQSYERLWYDIEAYEHSAEFATFENQIPAKYTNEYALDFFIDALETERADNKKELFNLFEEQLRHNENMRMQLENHQSIERMHQESMQLGHTQLNALKDIEKQQQTQINQNKHLSKQVKYGNVVGTVNMLRKK